MSISAVIHALSVEMKTQIDTEVVVTNEQKQKFVGKKPTKQYNTKTIYPYEIDGDNVYLPFAYSCRTHALVRPSRDMFLPVEGEWTFGIELRDEQKIVRKEALNVLSKTGSVIVSTYTGFGKTAISISLSTTVKMQTMVIVNKLILMKQWEESINKFCKWATIQKIKSGDEIDPKAHFIIVNAINIPKRSRACYQNIGLVIVDECHLIMAETLSKGMQYLTPRYLIGLSATPYREDGLDKLLDLYFGETKIYRGMKREHAVYKVETGFQPKIEFASNGKLNWGVVLDSQAMDEARNDIIVDIVCNHIDRIFLILVKLVKHGEIIRDKLEAKGVKVGTLFGKAQDYDKDSQVLIGTNSKVGTGFDDNRLNALILAADVEAYFLQYLGRVFRTETVVPLIFDLIDNNSVLKRHFATRSKIYKEIGGIIKKYDFSVDEENTLRKLKQTQLCWSKIK